MKVTDSKPTYAIVGAGVAGATAALHLAELGAKVLLIEKGPSLVNGPPICHLHAGGNLYREISQEQCIELLEQSIETVRLFPHTLNKRPTVIAVPHSDPGLPEDLVERLQVISNCYRHLVEQDERNRVLGDPDCYYKLYSKQQLAQLSICQQPDNPSSVDDWVIPFAQHSDLDQLKYPVAVVQEYGWSVFRLAASVSLALDALPNCQVYTQTALRSVEECGSGWALQCESDQGKHNRFYADFLINACGYETGKLDDWANKPRQRLVEFKAAYVTHWPDCDQQWPEVVFHGPRGTENGMAQLTPYPNGVFQLHGMTEGITLFPDGLVASNEVSSQPELPLRLANKIEKGWQNDQIIERSAQAVRHLSQYMPSYSTAVGVSKPLFGAQQIPGDNVTLRSADVTFAEQNYARIEVVKGSSALQAAKHIASRWLTSDRVTPTEIESIHPVTLSLKASDVEKKARALAVERGYPAELALAID
ncbi:FAD-dependent oxidoreductase [Vibrio profundum]|uniref:FAD-dependent oxidoreductase n=1 Tax=Vibrio profundum TaxID=2910247 RepID=UPI003D0F38F1